MYYKGFCDYNWDFALSKGSVTYRFCPQETSMDVGGRGGGGVVSARDVSR